MVYFIALAVFVFAMFPFTQLYPLETYNQPYAIITSALFLVLVPMSLLQIPRYDRIALIYLALIGLLMFFAEVPQGIDPRELLYLISYLTPLLVVPPLFFVMRHRPAMARRLLSWAILAWVVVGAIQRFISLTFLNFLVTQSEDLSVNIAASGRGVLGFAPEPTHHALHLVSMATALMLLRGNRIVVGLAIGAAVLLAGSSFAVLAIAAGTLIWALSAPLKRSWFFLLAIFGMLLSTFLPYILSGDSRLVGLIDRALYSGTDVLISDASANARLSGIFLPIWETLSGGLLPSGISWQAWLEMRATILVENGWVFNLSEGGVASGFGLIFVQAGLFSIPIILLFIKRFLVDFSNQQVGLLTASAFFCFLGQLYLATPSFSIVYAALVYGLAERRRAHMQMHQMHQMQRAARRGHRPPAPGTPPHAPPAGQQPLPPTPQAS